MQSGSHVEQMEIAAWRDLSLPLLREELPAEGYARLCRWWDELLLDRYTPVLIHGDLWYEHLLVDRDRPALLGVVDFESAAIADPA